MELSIVIVTYKNGVELCNCIQSIWKYNDLGDEIEVIIVDNSPDNSVKEILSHEKGIQYYKNPQNGFGRGNNIGLLKSSGKYVLFLNPDTLINDFCFRKMIKLYNQSSSVGVMGFRLVDEKGNENNSYNIRMNYGLIKKIVLRISRKLNVFMPRYMYTCGADIFVERKAFELIGMFDENLFMYSEEEDIAYRFNTIGKKVVFEPSVVITHLQGKSTGHQDLRNRKVMLESTKYICEKYGFSFRKQIEKEVRAMVLLNKLRHLFGKPQKYGDDVVEYYKSCISD